MSFIIFRLPFSGSLSKAYGVRADVVTVTRTTREGRTSTDRWLLSWALPSSVMALESPQDSQARVESTAFPFPVSSWEAVHRPHRILDHCDTVITPRSGLCSPARMNSHAQSSLIFIRENQSPLPNRRSFNVLVTALNVSVSTGRQCCGNLQSCTSKSDQLCL